MNSQWVSGTCKMCGRKVEGQYATMPVHTVPRKPTPCPYSGWPVAKALKP